MEFRFKNYRAYFWIFYFDRSYWAWKIGLPTLYCKYVENQSKYPGPPELQWFNFLGTSTDFSRQSVPESPPDWNCSTYSDWELSRSLRSLSSRLMSSWLMEPLLQSYLLYSVNKHVCSSWGAFNCSQTLCTKYAFANSCSGACFLVVQHPYRGRRGWGGSDKILE